MSWNAYIQSLQSRPLSEIELALVDLHEQFEHLKMHHNMHIQCISNLQKDLKPLNIQTSELDRFKTTVKDMIQQGKSRISVIKAIAEHYNITLKQAKDLVDRHWEKCTGYKEMKEDCQQDATFTRLKKFEKCLIKKINIGKQLQK